MGDIAMFEEGYRKEITYQVSAVSDEDNNPATSNTYTLNKVRGDLEMEMVASIVEEVGIQRGTQVRFRTYIAVSYTHLENEGNHTRRKGKICKRLQELHFATK